MKILMKKEFRKKHNCKSCLYYAKTKKCLALLVCPLDDVWSGEDIKYVCPLDTDGTCPYKNEVGTCFGFCIREIMRDYRRGKTKKEQLEKGNQAVTGNNRSGFFIEGGDDIDCG